jgi:serine/threonine protein kinase
MAPATAVPLQSRPRGSSSRRPEAFPAEGGELPAAQRRSFALPTPGDTICGEIVLESLAPASLGAEVFQPVFIARDHGRDEPLWLTVVDAMFMSTSVDLSSFMAGANALMSVRHPSLVRVVLVDREEDYCVVGYEQLPGAESLSDLVDRGGGPRVLARVAVEVARGLAYLHRRGLLHGALTPGTVVLWEGAPVLWEYGLAALCDPTVFGPRSRSLGGDVVAPEIPVGAPMTPAADVYAWGAVMAAVASSEFGSEAVAAVLEGEVDPGHHGLLLGVVRQALAPEPGRRPRDGVHLLELLQRALASVDPNTEIEAPAPRDAGDDALRDLATRYLAEMATLEKATAARKPGAGPAAAVPPPATGGALGRVALLKRPLGEGSGPQPQAVPSGPGLGTPSPAEAAARWVSHSPETSASGWLRPAPPRAPGRAKGGLFNPRAELRELADGVRKRSILSAKAIAGPPPGDRPPPRRTGVPQAAVEDDITPREALPLVPARGSGRSIDFDVLTGDIPQSERETPSDVEIVARPAAPKSKRERDRERKRERDRKRGREPEPEIEPDLPDLHDENELPPMPDAEPGEGGATELAPDRSVPRTDFRVPRTPGPHGPPAGLMVGVLVLLCGVTALAATLTASSARGGLQQLWGGEAPVVAVEGGEGDEAGVGDDAAPAAAGPCPPGMMEIAAQPEPFCIDRAEYPGIDQAPATDVDLAHAQQACGARGHALCTEVQWARACRGNSGWSYPYGPRHELGRCRVGDERAAPGPSGTDPHCVTPEGVLDLVGNVAEWTQAGVVMGGSVRSAKDIGCDTSQRMKPKSSTAVVGFRCCSALAGDPRGAGG